MKVLVNTTDQTIDVGFDGFTYHINPNTKVLCEEKPAVFLHERYPWIAVEETPKIKGPSPIQQIEKRKTVPMQAKARPTSDMVITPRKTQDDTQKDGLPDSGTIDTDGVEWIGEGIEVEGNLTRGGSFH